MTARAGVKGRGQSQVPEFQGPGSARAGVRVKCQSSTLALDSDPFHFLDPFHFDKDYRINDD